MDLNNDNNNIIILIPFDSIRFWAYINSLFLLYSLSLLLKKIIDRRFAKTMIFQVFFFSFFSLFYVCLFNMIILLSICSLLSLSNNNNNNIYKNITKKSTFSIYRYIALIDLMQEADQIRSIKQIYDLVFQINLSLYFSLSDEESNRTNKQIPNSIDWSSKTGRSTTFFIISFILTFKRNRIE